jgi:hypothetical protein
MNRMRFVRKAVRALAYSGGVAAGAYAAYAGTAWLRYGRAHPSAGDDADPLLDRFMPAFEIAERHHRRVKAQADIAFAAACEVELERSRIIRGIFRSREIMLGADREKTERPRGLVAFTSAIGWAVLADVQGREIVMGSVTQPWRPSPTFRTLTPESFAAFDEPDYVKIAWTLRADPLGTYESVVGTETRVITTDRRARTKFRRYWSIFSPGIVLIRRIALGLVAAEAERRAHKVLPEGFGDDLDCQRPGGLV